MRLAVIASAVFLFALVGEVDATTLLPKTYASLRQHHTDSVVGATEHFNSALGNPKWTNRIHKAVKKLGFSLKTPLRVHEESGILLVISNAKLGSAKTVSWQLQRDPKTPAVMVEATWADLEVRSRINQLLKQGSIHSLQSAFSTSVVHFMGGKEHVYWARSLCSEPAAAELRAALRQAVVAAKQVGPDLQPNGRVSGVQFGDGAPNLVVETAHNTAGIPIRVSEAGHITFGLDLDYALLSVVTHQRAWAPQ